MGGTETSDGASPIRRRQVNGKSQESAVRLEALSGKRAAELAGHKVKRQRETKEQQSTDLGFEAASEHSHRSLFETMTQGVVYQDAQGKITAANPAAAEILGLTLDQMQGRTSVDPRWQAIRTDGSPFPGDEHPSMVSLRTGRETHNVIMGVFNPVKNDVVWINISAVPQFRDGEGKPYQVYTAFDDITEQRRAEQETEKFKFMVDGTAEEVYLVRPDGSFAYVNKAAASNMGYSVAEMLKLSVPEIDDTLGTGFPSHFRELRERKLPPFETVSRAKNGRRIHKEIQAEYLKIGSDEYLCAFGRDITERKRAEEKLVHTAFHDKLTDLPNRALFVDRLQHAARRYRRQSRALFAIVYLDTDGLKLINDSLGHAIGDRVLIAVGKRLRECVRAGDTVARLGGDEFALLLENLDGRHEATGIVERIGAALADPLNVDGRDIRVTASVGLAFPEDSGATPDDVLLAADIAMYQAKVRGPANYEVFGPEMRAEFMDRRQLDADLRSAVEHNAIRAWFQPIVSLRSGRIVGFEALARWRHATRGWVRPDEFIPVAEESDLIELIGKSILEQACEYAGSWQAIRSGNEAVKVSVNVSTQQLRRAGSAFDVHQIIRKTGTPAGLLCLEVTEGAILQFSDAIVSSLGDLRGVGAQIHLDDFGLGYSSLAYLHYFPADAIKIHRSFVGAVDPADKGRQITRSIVTLARNLEIAAVAEGIEQPEQLEWLRGLGCDLGQGFLFSAAVPPESAEELLRSDPRW